MQPLESILYSIPYCILVLLILVTGVVCRGKKRENKCCWIIGILLVVFFGLRGLVQTDWEIYYWLYERIPSLLDGSFHVEDGHEQGFTTITQIFKTIVPNYYVWIFLNTVIDISLFMVVFRRYSASVALSWVFFLMFTGLVLEFNLMRNVKAIIIFLFSIPYIQKRQFWKFLLCCCAGLLFHSSSLFYIPLYFVLTRNFGKFFPIIMFVVLTTAYVFDLHPSAFLLDHLPLGNSHIVMKMQFYLSHFGTESHFGFGDFERMLTFFIVYRMYGKLVRQRRVNIIFCNAYYVYFISWYLFADVPVLLERIPTLLAFSYWILYPNVIALLKGEVRRLANILIIFFAMFKMISITSHILYQYDNQLTGLIPLENRQEALVRYMMAHSTD